MIFWIVMSICALIFVGCTITAMMEADGEYFFAGLVISIIIIFTWFLIGIFPVTGTHVDHTSNTYSLQAINTGTQTNGHFFLGTGGLGQNAVFYAYTRDSKGEFKLIQIAASDAKIIESSNTPRVVYGCGDWKGKSFWYGPIHNWLNDAPACDDTDYGSVTFYVPPGSITNSINLTLPKS